jgi:hypothetical protein
MRKPGELTLVGSEPSAAPSTALRCSLRLSVHRRPLWRAGKLMRSIHIPRRVSQIGRELALAISFGIGGVGIAEFALALVGKGLGSLDAGLESGAIFAIAAVVTRRVKDLRHSRELSILTGASCFVLLSITWIGQSLLPLTSEHAAYQRVPIIAGVSSLIVCLLSHLDWYVRARIATAAVTVAKVVCQVLGAATIGAGIGFLQGAAVYSGQPNMIQDGGALLGSVVGGAIGVASFWSRLAGPEAASSYGVGVTVCFVCGLVAAKMFGIASMFVTPVVALVILSVLSGQSRRRAHTAPELDTQT